MSLKAFHLFFITISTLLAFGFGAWSVYFHVTHGRAPYLMLGVLSFATGGVLVVYGIKVFHRFKHL